MIISSKNERKCKVILQKMVDGVIHQSLLELHCEAPGEPLEKKVLLRTLGYDGGLLCIEDVLNRRLVKDKEGNLQVLRESGSSSFYSYVVETMKLRPAPVALNPSELSALEKWIHDSKDLLKFSVIHPKDTVEGPDEVGMSLTLAIYHMALVEASSNRSQYDPLHPCSVNSIN